MYRLYNSAVYRFLPRGWGVNSEYGKVGGGGLNSIVRLRNVRRGENDTRGREYSLGHPQALSY